MRSQRISFRGLKRKVYQVKTQKITNIKTGKSGIYNEVDAARVLLDTNMRDDGFVGEVVTVKNDNILAQEAQVTAEQAATDAAVKVAVAKVRAEMVEQDAAAAKKAAGDDASGEGFGK